MNQPHGFETLAIHAGQEPDVATGAVVPPIYQSSTFKQDGVGNLRGGYEYSRAANPTRSALEECLAALEAGSHASAFASGLAAEDSVLRAVCAPGDHVIVPDEAYGGSLRLFRTVLSRWGLTTTAVNLGDAQSVRAAVRSETRLIWCETPTNPLLGLADIQVLAGIAHEAGALLAVDNTFASPYLQQPLTLGADLVVHSTTKYIGGHSDVVGGAVIARDAELAERIHFQQFAAGAIAGPFDAWLTMRGLKTLAVRMDRHCDNAEQIAAVLAAHPRVTRVLYPGLPDHPGHETARKQMRRFGGMISFQLDADEDEASELCGRTRLFTLAESLGGVESLIEHPARMTHLSVKGTPQEVPGNLIRISVGIENAADLIADLVQALN